MNIYWKNLRGSFAFLPSNAPSFASLSWVLLLMGICLLGNPLWGQQRQLGLIENDQAYNQAPRMHDYGSGSNFANLPLRVDLSEFAPVPGDQGDEPNCVGWAAGYAGLTIALNVLAEELGRPPSSERAFSADYLYNSIRSGRCDQGAILNDAFELLRREGDCYQDEFSPANCYEQPSPQLRERANRHRITSYLTLFGTNAPSEQKGNLTKRLLSQQRPVIVGMRVRNNFMNIPSGTRFWNPETGDTRYAGGHAMCVIGYDESMDAFCLMNSWGTDWADGGFVWIRYDDFGEYCKYAYVMTVNPSPAQVHTVELSGEVAFRMPSGYDRQARQYTFDYLRPGWEQDMFELESEYEVGDMFQLLAINAQPNEFIYAFSLDPRGKVTIHYPLKASYPLVELDAANNKPLNPAALVPTEGAHIVIPGEEEGLEIGTPGDDHLCVLYSDRPIEDFNAVVTGMRDASGPFMQRLQAVLGDRLIPTADAQFKVKPLENVEGSPNGMRFDARSASGHIVAVVLKVTAH